jgi:hypothetical protein
MVELQVLLWSCQFQLEGLGQLINFDIRQVYLKEISSKFVNAKIRASVVNST